jgi:Zn-dependent M28 family amino/carboxypeptidase
MAGSGLAPIGPAHLRAHVTELTVLGPRHCTNPVSVTACLGYLRSQLAGHGHQARIERYGPAPDEVNLLVEIPGTRPGLPWIEVGAHWDTVEASPGADDNASGVAGLLEIARVLALLGQPRQGVRLCLFGGEEGWPGFAGSIAHVSTMDDRSEGVIVLEMIGYRSAVPGSQRVPDELSGMFQVPDTGDFIAVLGDANSADYVDAIEAAARREAPGLAVLGAVLPDALLPVVSRSDHVPYWRAGLKGVLVTDTSEYRNPHYHQADDVLAALDLGFAAQVSTMVAAAVVELAGPWSDPG